MTLKLSAKSTLQLKYDLPGPRKDVCGDLRRMSGASLFPAERGFQRSSGQSQTPQMEDRIHHRERSRSLLPKLLEDFAVIKKPGGGKCPKSSFADGQHRAGLVPVMSVLDGGAPGDLAEWFCVDCEKRLPRRRMMFILIDQPNTLRKGSDEKI